MEPEQLSSIYDLITKLCERFLNASGRRSTKKSLQKLRATAYEILLSKQIIPSDLEMLENNKDPLCHLLAWEFLLINKYNMPNHAKKIQRCIESLQRSLPTDDDTFMAILYVLVQLRSLPEEDTEFSSQTMTPMDSCVKFRRFNEFSFYLNAPMICNEAKFKDSSFRIRPVPKFVPLPKLPDECKDCARVPSRVSCTSLCSLKEEDKEPCDLIEKDKKPDIWEFISTTVFMERRTWETLGNPCPEPELPFLTESLPKVCSVFYDLQRWHSTGYLTEFKVSPTTFIEQGVFIKHIKFLLVGMTSDSFKFNMENQLCLVNGISIEGLSSYVLQEYSRDLIFCGSCYKALNAFCNMSMHCYGNQSKGFIFKEFCDSIKRYLSYYRVATLSISEDTGLLKVQDYIKPLRDQLRCLASICKVGPYGESSELPSGVALLNYIYEKLISLTSKDVMMVLYSILYPCIQVYFSRFLQQWIFEGIVNDPYNEFFVHNVQKFNKARSRSYWTKCFIIQVDIIPDFLSELAQDILYCGKVINLLKLCTPSNSLCLYTSRKKLSLMSCHLNSEQVHGYEQESTCYYFEALSACGSTFSMQAILNRAHENRLIIADLATRKRAATIKRLEMEKLKKANEDFEEKQKTVSRLKADYDKALQDKKSAIINDVMRELKCNESMLKIQKLRKKVIEEEALKLIDYYDGLIEISERKRLGIEKYMDHLKSTDLQVESFHEQTDSVSMFYSTTEINKASNKNSEENIEIIQEKHGSFDSTSESSFHSASSENALSKENEIFPFVAPSEMVTDCVCLDMINANSSSESFKMVSNGNMEASNDAFRKEMLMKMVLENKEAALRNKQTVMSVEMGIRCGVDTNENSHGEPKTKQKELTELQKNRLKVLSSEFGLNLTLNDLKNKRDEQNVTKFSLSDGLIGKEKVIGNEIYINETLRENNNINTVIIENLKNDENDNNLNNNKISSKEHNLKLDLSKIRTNELTSNSSIFSRFWKSPNFELSKPIPMSIDSTPCTGCSASCLDKDISCSHSLSTTTSYITEEFNFSKDTYLTYTNQLSHNIMLSKQMPLSGVELLSPDCLKLFIQQSIAIPVNVQTKLVDNELLKYIFVELKYLSHLNNLRNYFFLLDGEFGRNITEGLFEKLYDVNFPVDLINIRTLQNLVRHALDSSIRSQKDFEYLSFKINNLPKRFDLGNPDVLDCLSLTYRMNWPLNILLPSDIVSKYDEVFKFLLKLNRMSWVLKKTFQELKLLTKNSGRKSSFLILSPEFNRIQYCRHIMTHFVQTLQNYIVGEVLQPSWDAFEKNLTSITNLNDIYNLHNSYVKDILFLCLLNKRFTPIRKVIQNVFVVILKFHYYLSSKKWIFDNDEGTFAHPNFQKLENIFSNFEEFVVYVFKAGRKVARVGYQPHLVQLLDMLDVNGYYSKHITEPTSN